MQRVLETGFPFAEVDAVAVIPQDRLKSTISLALEHIESENASREMLEKRFLLPKGYDRYGVLQFTPGQMGQTSLLTACHLEITMSAWQTNQY